MGRIIKTLALALIAVGATNIAVHADNLLKSSEISKENGWTTWIHAPCKEAGGSIVFEGGKALVKSPVLDKLQIQFIQAYNIIDIPADKKYKVSFTAKTDKEGKISIHYLLNTAPYTDYALQDVTLSPGEKNYEAVLDVKPRNGAYESPRSLRFFLSGIPDANISVSNVVLEEQK